MSDTPTPPVEGSDGGAPGEGTAWYANPATWVAALVALAVIIGIIFLVTNDDDDEDVTTASSTTTTSTSSTSTSTSSTTSTTAPEATTTTAPEGSDTGGDTGDTGDTPGGDLTAIAESAVVGPLVRYDDTGKDMPFADGEAESHWYKWEDSYVVVYAGWDATKDPTMCPGNSIEVAQNDFMYVSNSPAGDGGCDPESVFEKSLIPEGEDAGARVCDGLVVFLTRIPVMADDGAPQAGNLYGTVERSDDGDLVGATGAVAADYEKLTDLDPDAAGYSIPEGWLDGKTEVSC